MDYQRVREHHVEGGRVLGQLEIDGAIWLLVVGFGVAKVVQVK